MRKWDKRGRRGRIVRSLRYVAGVSTGMTLDPQSADSIQQIGVIPTIYPPVARQDPSNVISVDTEGVTRSPQTEEYCSHAAGGGVFAHLSKALRPAQMLASASSVNKSPDVLRGGLSVLAELATFYFRASMTALRVVEGRMAASVRVASGR